LYECARGEKPDPVDLLRWLRLGTERRGEERARYRTDEAPPVHHWITSLAHSVREHPAERDHRPSQHLGVSDWMSRTAKATLRHCHQGVKKCVRLSLFSCPREAALVAELRLTGQRPFAAMSAFRKSVGQQRVDRRPSMFQTHRVRTRQPVTPGRRPNLGCRRSMAGLPLSTRWFS